MCDACPPARTRDAATLDDVRRSPYDSVYTFTCMDMYICMHVCMYVCMYVCIYIYIYTQIHSYIRSDISDHVSHVQFTSTTSRMHVCLCLSISMCLLMVVHLRTVRMTRNPCDLVITQPHNYTLAAIRDVGWHAASCEGYELRAR